MSLTARQQQMIAWALQTCPLRDGEAERGAFSLAEQDDFDALAAAFREKLGIPDAEDVDSPT